MLNLILLIWFSFFANLCWFLLISMFSCNSLHIAYSIILMFPWELKLQSFIVLSLFVCQSLVHSVGKKKQPSAHKKEVVLLLRKHWPSWETTSTETSLPKMWLNVVCWQKLEKKINSKNSLLSLLLHPHSFDFIFIFLSFHLIKPLLISTSSFLFPSLSFWGWRVRECSGGPYLLIGS